MALQTNMGNWQQVRVKFAVYDVAKVIFSTRVLAEKGANLRGHCGELAGVGCVPAQVDAEPKTSANAPFAETRDGLVLRRGAAFGLRYERQEGPRCVAHFLREGG